MDWKRRIAAWTCAAAVLSCGLPAFSQEQKRPEQDASEQAEQESAQQKAVDLLTKAQQQYSAGEWEQAKKTFEKAFEAADDHGRIQAQTALEWSSLLWEQGEYDAAEKRVAQALELAREHEMNEAIGRLLLTQGHIEASKGKLRSAENTLKICIRLTAEQQDEVFEALCKLNHRLVRQLRGRPAGPEADYRKAISKIEAAGTPLAVGSSLAKTSELYAQNGDADKALGLLLRAQKQFEKADSVPAQMRNRLRIAKLLQDQSRYQEARKYLRGLVQKFDEMNNRPALVDALILNAEDAKSQGKLDQAHKDFVRAHEVAKQTKSPNLIARGHLDLCEFGTSTGKVSGAIDHCQAAAAKFEKLGIPDLAARSNAQIARQHHASGELNKASAKYSQVIQTLEKTGVPGTADTPAIAGYRANLCQVETSLRSNGAHHLCIKALEELEAQSSPDPGMLAATHYAVGVTAGRDAWSGRGLDHLNKAAKIALTQTPPDRDLASDAMLRRGIILKNLGDRHDEAVHDFKKGIAIALEGDSDALRQSRVELRVQLAQVQLDREDWKEAKQTIEKIVGDAKADTASKAWAYSGLARAELKLGNKKKAERALKKGLPLAKQAGDVALVKNFEENLAKFEE